MPHKSKSQPSDECIVPERRRSQRTFKPVLQTSIKDEVEQTTLEDDAQPVRDKSSHRKTNKKKAKAVIATQNLGTEGTIRQTLDTKGRHYSDKSESESEEDFIDVGKEDEIAHKVTTNKRKNGTGRTPTIRSDALASTKYTKDDEDFEPAIKKARKSRARKQKSIVKDGKAQDGDVTEKTKTAEEGQIAASTAQTKNSDRQNLADFAAVNLTSSIKGKKPKTPVKQKAEDSVDQGDIKRLLLQFETQAGASVEAGGVTMEMENGSKEESDWEEVEDIGGDEEPEVRSPFPQQSVEVTLEAFTLNRKKKKKKFDVQDWFRLQMNKYRRETQMNVYKVHLLCFLSHGFHRNRLCNNPSLQATLLSVLPKPFHGVSYKSISVATLTRFTEWFASFFTLDPSLEPGHSDLEMTLISRVSECAVRGGSELVYLFIALLRMLGLDTRLVLSLQPASHKATDLKIKKKEDSDELPSTSKKSVKKKVDQNICSKTKVPQAVKSSKCRRKKSCDKPQGSPLDKNISSRSGEDYVSPYFSEENERRSKSKLDGRKKTEVLSTSCDAAGKKGLDKRDPVLSQKRTVVKVETDDEDECEVKRETTTEEMNETITTRDSVVKNEKSAVKSEDLIGKNKSMGKGQVVGKSRKNSGVKRAAKVTEVVEDLKDNQVGRLGRSRRKSKVVESYCELSDDRGSEGGTRARTNRRNKDEKSSHGHDSDLEYKAETLSSDEDFQVEETKYRSPTHQPVGVKKRVRSRGSTDTVKNRSPTHQPQPVRVKKRVRSRGSTDGVKPVRILSSDSETSVEVIRDRGTDHWVEVYLTSELKWVCVDCQRALVDVTEKMEGRATSPLQYVVAFNPDGTCKDLTQKYAQNWLSHTHKLRVDEAWWEETMDCFKGAESIIDTQEDLAIKAQMMKQPIPTSVAQLKNHPLYILKRHLLKFEAIYPVDAPPLGFVRGEPVYARECVHTLHSRENWLKEARVVRLKEEAYKWVKARPKRGKKADGREEALLAVFGFWQTEDYIPPPAVNGKVPWNEYGNVELFKASMLPGGTVHLQVPGLNRVAKKLGLDCVAAMVGWDHHSGYAHPILDGWIVCVEHKDTLLAAWDEQQEIDREREQQKRELRVYERWRKFVRGLLIKERLKKKYNLTDSQDSGVTNTKSSDRQETAETIETTDTAAGKCSGSARVAAETAMAWPRNRQKEKDDVKRGSGGKRGSRKTEQGEKFPFEMDVETM